MHLTPSPHNYHSISDPLNYIHDCHFSRKLFKSRRSRDGEFSRYSFSLSSHFLISSSCIGSFSNRWEGRDGEFQEISSQFSQFLIPAIFLVLFSCAGSFQIEGRGVETENCQNIFSPLRHF